MGIGNGMNLRNGEVACGVGNDRNNTEWRENFVIGCNLVNGLKNSQSSILIVAVICEFH